MKKSIKKYEVSLSEIKHGHVVVEATSRREATQLALQNYHRGDVTMSDSPDIKTEAIKEIAFIGFRPH